MSIQNTSSKDYTIELVPPNPKLSGIIVNPLVNTLKANSGALVSLKYNSKFRDLTHAIMDSILNPVLESSK